MSDEPEEVNYSGQPALLHIRRNDQIILLTKAKMIPDGEMVTKPNGNKPYTFKRNLTLYQSDKKEKPVLIAGWFLVSMDGQGGIIQITEDMELRWAMNAEDLVERLSAVWEREDDEANDQ